jgi:hypothetical protein
LRRAGSFGEISDPTSQALQEFLARLQEQAQQVRDLIAVQQQLSRGVKQLQAPHLSNHMGMGTIPVGRQASLSHRYPDQDPQQPRVSEGAISIESKRSHVAARQDELAEVIEGGHATVTVSTGPVFYHTSDSTHICVHSAAKQ